MGPFQEGALLRRQQAFPSSTLHFDAHVPTVARRFPARIGSWRGSVAGHARGNFRASVA